MIKIAIITLLIVTVIGLFIPEKYVPKQKKRTPLFKNWHPDDKGSLPWFGKRKRSRKDNRYNWDD